MGYGAWSPLHTILVLYGIAAFIGHVAIMVYLIDQLQKRTDKIGEQMENGFSAIQSEIRDLRLEVSTVNHIDPLNQHHDEKVSPSG